MEDVDEAPCAFAVRTASLASRSVARRASAQGSLSSSQTAWSSRRRTLLQRWLRVGILADAGAKRFRFSCREPIMPFKLHSKGRRHILRQRHRVTNWREYDVCLRSRGSLTIWFTPDAIAGWKAEPRTPPGGQRHYSNLAIETALTLRTVFRLALRQSEGLTGSIMRMLEIDPPVPDHTTLGRRACGLPVQMRWRKKTSVFT